MRVGWGWWATVHRDVVALGSRRPHVAHRGHGDGPWAEDLIRAFDQCLVTDVEAVSYGLAWDTVEDGLEPWLGDIAHP